MRKASYSSIALIFWLLFGYVFAPCQNITLEQITQTLVNGVSVPAYNGGVRGLIWPHPTLADIDNDDDYDLFVGTSDGRISFFENQGTPAQAQFVFITAFYSSIDVGSSAAPTFYDINADGDLDLFVGNGTNGGGGGTVYYYENTGTAQTAEWTLQTTTLADLDAWDFFVPTLSDVDSDGDADLIVGGGYGSLFFVQNIGTVNAPIWAPQISNYTGIIVGYKATPHLADFDCDGKPDLIIGNDKGKLYFLKNMGTNVSGIVQWSQITATFTNVDFTHLDYTSPACADLDDDGDIDILLSEHYGNVNYFENTGDSCNPQWRWVTGDLLSGTIDVGQSAFPTLVDIDGDCDFDLFIGKANGQIRYYRNEGTTDQPNWVLVTENFLGFDTGGTWTNPAKPVFTDFDFDGDFDLVIAGSGSRYYENTGSADSSAFQLVSSNFLPSNLAWEQSPVFADFNGDSLMDAAHFQYANASQSIFIWLNSGQAGAPWLSQPSDTISAGPYSGYFFQALDYDYDGDPDFLFVNLSGDHKILLLRNTSTDWSLEVLLNDTPSDQPASAFWVDIDQDYDWDLFTGTGNGGIFFWQNTSNWAQAGFSWSSNLLSVQFTDSSFQANGWYWNFGDGNFSDEQNPMHNYAIPGEYEVCLTAKNGCKEWSVCKTIDLCIVPVSQFSLETNELSAIFTNSSEWATYWHWDFGDNQTSNEQNPSHNYAAPGEYTICLTTENACGENNVCQTFLLCTSPVPIFNLSVQQSTIICSNSSVWAEGYLWDFGDGQTSTESNPTHTYETDGFYVVSLTAMNLCDTVTMVQSVEIITPPVAHFSAQDTAGCVPFEVVFENQSSVNAATYSWTFHGGTPATSSEQNPVVTYPSAGVYDVSLVVCNALACDSFYQAGFIVTNDLPLADFTFSTNENTDTVSFFNTSVNAITYEWNFGDGQNSMEASPTHAYSHPGEYEVTLTATNDCGSTSFTQAVEVITGLKDVLPLENFTVFPNPNDGHFTLSLKGKPQSTINVSLFDARGQKLFSEIFNFQSGQVDKSLDFSHLPVGVYWLSVSFGEKIGVEKIVKI